MSTRWVLGVALAGLMTAPVLASDFRVPADATPGAVPDAPRPVDLASVDLVKIIDRDAAAAAALKDEDYYPAALAETFGGDPMKAYDWVKANTHFQPYPGVLRGAARTLAARAGSAADRALLLAALLKEMNVKTRFASAQLDDAALDTVMKSAFAQTSISMDAPRGGTLDAIAMRAGRDYALLRTALAAEADAAVDTSLAEAREAARNHVWVEAEIGGVWTALDPEAAAAGATLATASETTDALPDALFQTVTLKLSATVITDGAVAVSEPLNVTLTSAKVSAAAIFLAFTEHPDSGGIGGAINGVMGMKKRYVPVLWVEGEPTIGAVIPGLEPAAEDGAVQDFLGSDDEAPKPELARLDLIIETAGPGGVTATATRTLLDRAPSVAAIAGDTPLAAMPMAEALPAPAATMHNIWISTGPLNLKNAYGLRALALSEVVTTYSVPEKAEGLSPPELLWPVAAFNAALPMALENSALPAMNSNPDVRVFTGTPRVTIFSRGAMTGPEGAAYRSVEIDLKLGGARVVAREGAAKAAFEARLWVGAVEAALETEVGLRGGMSLLDPATTTLAGASSASDAPLVRMGAGGEAVTPDAPRNAAAAVADGRALFAPAGAMVAWWEADPRTGVLKAVLAPDLGGFRSYGGYSPPPSNTLDSSLTRARTGMQQNPYRRPPGGGGGGPPAGSCSGGTEETTILGCVSLPAGWALRQFYALLIFDIVITATDIIMYNLMVE